MSGRKKLVIAQLRFILPHPCQNYKELFVVDLTIAVHVGHGDKFCRFLSRHISSIRGHRILQLSNTEESNNE